MIGKLDGALNHLVRLAEPRNIPHHCYKFQSSLQCHQAFTHIVYFLYIHCTLLWYMYNLQHNIYIQVFKTSATFNTLRPRQKWLTFGRRFFKYIFVNENAWILLNNSLKFIRAVQINNIPPSVQLIAWCRLGDKPLSYPMMVRLPTHICATSLWVNMALFWYGAITHRMCTAFKNAILNYPCYVFYGGCNIKHICYQKSQ